MKAFLSAVFAVAVVGTASWAIFSKTFQDYSEKAFTTSSVRLPEH